MHAPGILEENLSDDKLKGALEAQASSDVPDKVSPRIAPESKDAESPEVPGLPELHTLINAADFEKAASKSLTPKTWAFYSSAATDLITHQQNKNLVRRIMIQPRILRDVKHVDFRRKILGCESSAPFFISPAAMARLAHPDGELALAKAARAERIIQCVSWIRSRRCCERRLTESKDFQQCVISTREHSSVGRSGTALFLSTLRQLRKA